jgi:hypothetical protein
MISNRLSQAIVASGNPPNARVAPIEDSQQFAARRAHDIHRVHVAMNELSRHALHQMRAEFTDQPLYTLCRVAIGAPRLHELFQQRPQVLLANRTIQPTTGIRTLLQA